MFHFAEGLGEDVGPIEIGINFDNLYVTRPDVVLEAVALERDVFSSDLGAFTMG